MIVKYLKGRLKYIVLFLIIISIINIYLFAINIFENQCAELIYLDFLVSLIIIVFFIVDYINFKNSYKDLCKCLENNDDIDNYLIEK